MATNFVKEGDTLAVTAPYAVASGAGALVGSLFGVAVNSAENAAEVVLALEGVFTLAKASGAWTVGAKLYWDDTNKNVTTTASGNTLIGRAAAAAASGDTTGNVLLTRGA